MKCIKYKIKGTIERTNNATARAMVKAGLAEYCPKHEWKAQVRGLPGKEVVNAH